MVPKVLVCVPTAEFARQAVFYDHLRLAMDPTYVRGYIGLHAQSPARNRNIGIQQLLNKPEDFTHIFFVDDDVILPQDTLKKLVAHDKDIVSGAYLMRAYPHQFIAFDSHNGKGGARHLYPELGVNGLVEVANMGLGCCLIRREVFEKMLPDCSIQGNDCHDFVRLGELVTDHWCDDFGFFKRAQEHGFKLFMDLSVKCGHMCTMTVYPDYKDGRHLVRYDTNGKNCVTFPMATLSEIEAANGNVK